MLKDSHGNIFEGQFLKGKKVFGRETFPRSGELYEGEYVANKKEGIGILTFNMGDILSYEGEFRDDKVCVRKKNKNLILFCRDMVKA